MSTTDPKPITIQDIDLEQIKSHIDAILNVLPHLQQAKEGLDAKSQRIQNEVMQFALSLKLSELDPSKLEAFFKKPYFLVPIAGKRENWHLYLPRFIPAQIGYLDFQDDSYNRFLVNRYTDWLGEIPEAIKRELKFETPLELKIRGDEVFGPVGDLEKAWSKPEYRQFLVKKENDRLKINPKRTFELIAQFIKDRILPFDKHLLDKEDLAERRCDFELRDYQREIWQKFEQYSTIGVYIPPGTGKTIIGLYAMTHLKPPHLVAVPTQLLKEQWVDRIEAHTDLKVGQDVFVETYSAAIKKQGDKQFTLKFFDEVQHLPADYTIKFSLIKSRYTIGASATPMREDGREEYIFALTGFPVGLTWQSFKELKLIKNPTCHVWVVKTQTEKIDKVKNLLMDQKRTVVFCDGIEYGKTVSKALDVPFVYGETKGRYKIIKENRVIVVSRVGEEGMSIPDLEQVIEVDWLFGSRRQEAQRFGRLLHGAEAQGEGVHHILMTQEEFARDRKRLFGIMDKGFDTQLHTSMTEEQVQKIRERMPRSPIGQRRSYVAPATNQTPATTEQPQKLDIPDGPTKDLVSAPGVQRILAQLSGPEKRFYIRLVVRDGEWHSRKGLPMILGYTGDNTMKHLIGFKKLVDRNWIESKREGGTTFYRTNIRGGI